MRQLRLMRKLLKRNRDNRRGSCKICRIRIPSLLKIIEGLKKGLDNWKWRKNEFNKNGSRFLLLRELIVDKKTR